MICVLFVEDEKYVADSLAALFRRNGIEAVSLPSAEEALGAPPGDVVVADLELPGLSQVELLRRIKERIGADLEAPRRVASENLDLKVRVKSFQRGLFIEALRRTGGKKSRAARLLGIDPSNWAYHAKRLGIAKGN